MKKLGRNCMRLNKLGWKRWTTIYSLSAWDINCITPINGWTVYRVKDGFNWVKTCLFLESFSPLYLIAIRIQYWVRVYFKSRFALKLSDSELIQWFILNYLLIEKSTVHFLWILLLFRKVQKSLHSWFWNLSESVQNHKNSLKLFWISTYWHWNLGTGKLLQTFSCPVKMYPANLCLRLLQNSLNNFQLLNRNLYFTGDYQTL